MDENVQCIAVADGPFSRPCGSTVTQPQLQWVIDDLVTWAPVLATGLAARPQLPIDAQSDDAAKPYSRTLLHRCSMGEVVLIRWRPERACEVHDHAGGNGRVYVLQGQVREQRWPSEESLHAGERPAMRTVAAGQVLPICASLVHAMDNPLPQETVTLHAYRAMAGPMRVLSIGARATYYVSDSHGAWLPAQADILREVPWPSA